MEDVRTPNQGEKSKPWRVYRIGDEGEQLTLVAEADTREGLAAQYKRRADWRYGTYHNRKRVD